MSKAHFSSTSPTLPAVPLPFQQVARLYETAPTRRSFADDLAAHLRHGVLLSTPVFFVMARPVPRAATPAAINDPSISFPPARCDTWYIYAFAGHIPSALRHFPYLLPFLAFERHQQNGLRFLSLPRFLAKCHSLLPPAISLPSSSFPCID